ncbi:hypothetical protein ACGFZB_35240 [Streptomyces cinerochromogenes]|uniref:Uncharacterized protein n=1 Tax=Streptomyces cinerochromogenes TaxID=66422 RepID=A0ABW7BER0_9ACTN
MRAAASRAATRAAAARRAGWKGVLAASDLGAARGGTRRTAPPTTQDDRSPA